MEALSTRDMLSLIADLTDFADRSEKVIQQTQAAYQGGRRNLDSRHKSSLSSAERDYNNNRNALLSKSRRMLQDAQGILTEINSMDQRLSSLDKYYVKTKKKKLESLKGRNSEKYSDVEDYVTALESIKRDYQVIYNKYTTDILPSLINFLSYVFSSKRKKDYEDLILLKNTVGAFITELESMLNSIVSENTAAMQQEYSAQRSAMIQRQQNEKYSFENNQAATFDALAGELFDSLDELIPDGFVTYLQAVISNYISTYQKVNVGDSADNGIFNLCFVDYPIEWFVKMPVLSATILDKCAPLVVNNNTIRLPLVTSTSESPAILVKSDNSCPEEVNALVHSLMYGTLSSAPVSTLSFCVIDPEGRGNNIYPFFEARKKMPELFGDKIYTSRNDISNQIKAINDFIEDTMQNKLSTQYSNVFEYAENNVGSNSNVTLLLLFDFPKGIDDDAQACFRNILRNGSKCGVFTIIVYPPDTEQFHSNEYKQSIKAVEELTTIIQQTGKEFSVDGLPLHYIPMPSSNQFMDFFIEYIEEHEKRKSRGISIDEIFEKGMFEGDSSKSLDIDIGVDDADGVTTLSLGTGSSHHGIIIGATGSGKSTLLHTLIISGMLRYSPEQLNLYLMDFKQGTEFKIYESKRLPHIKLLAIDAKQEFGESILENLIVEMEHRGEEFKEYKVSKISDYVKASGKSMPRILVIMDEFQILYNDSTNRKVANNCAELTKRIVTEGRAFGIHLIMATQTTKVVSELTLTHATIEQMRVRIALKCGEDDARYLFTDRNEKSALKLMKGPTGRAVINPEYMEGDNCGFRVAYCDDEAKEKYLSIISQKFESSPYDMKIFEGGRTENLLDFYSKTGFGISSESPARIPLGTLIKISPPYELILDRKRKHNLLVCGSNETMMTNIINSCIISAMLNTGNKLYCIDGDTLIGEEGSEKFYDIIGSYTMRFSIAKDRSAIIHMIKEIYSLYEERKQNGGDGNIVVVIKNLQFIDLIRTMLKQEHVDESEYSEQQSEADAIVSGDLFASVNNYLANRSSSGNMSTGDKLIRLMSDGSGYGIHFIVGSTEYQVVRECMHYSSQTLSKFNDRIIFSLSNQDADNLIDGISVSGLDKTTVCYTNGVNRTFQLKPYVAPNNNELKAFMDQALGKK